MTSFEPRPYVSIALHFSRKTSLKERMHGGTWIGAGQACGTPIALRMRLIKTTRRHPISFPEAAILLVSTKDTNVRFPFAG